MIQQAATFIKKSHALIIGTGAGMGKDSGLPDFRGNEGFWNNYPSYRNKFNFMQCANPDFLLTNPHLFWGFYGSRLNMYREKEPHQGYQILKEIARIINSAPQGDNYFAVTSNVDGHFQKANYPSNRILQVHGSIHHMQCDNCQQIQDNTFQPQIDYNEMSCKNLPTCAKCNEILRPNILMFNDWSWLDDRQSQQEKQYRSFLKTHAQSNIVLIQIGSGGAIPTIRNMMEQVLYLHKQSKLIRINTDPNTSSKWLNNPQKPDQKRYIHIPLSALEALRQIRKQLQ